MNIIRKSNLLGSEVAYTSHIPQEGMNEWKRRTISTGSQNLDSLLGGGGVRIGEVTEFHGASLVGKTEICYGLCISASQHGEAIFVDTEGSYCSRRIYEIAEKRKCDPSLALQNIKAVKVNSCWEQENYLAKIEKQLSSPGNVASLYKLIIIDSVIANYKAEFCGRENLPKRQQELYSFMKKLNKIANTYDIAVVITNHISKVPDTNEICTFIPAGGDTIGYNVTHRITMKRRPGVCSANIYSSRYLPDTKIVYYSIGQDGIRDY